MTGHFYFGLDFKVFGRGISSANKWLLGFGV